MAEDLEFILNGRPVRAGAISPNTTLLDFLRSRGLTGSKEGCAEGDCGACSVVLLDADAEGRPVYRAINSCLVPVCLLAGRELVSVEGVGCAARLHPVQREMVERHGSQCGYCTPGFICSLFEGYYRDDLRTEDDLDDQLSGNLCRCTGYRPIREAAMAAFAARSSRGDAAQIEDHTEPPHGRVAQSQKRETSTQAHGTEAGNSSDLTEGNVLRVTDPRSGTWATRSHAGGCEEDDFAVRLKMAAMKLPPAACEFAGEKFFRPVSLAELLRLRTEHPGARLIAGATELGLDISKRFQKFAALISTEAVAELKEFKATATEWHIGAAVTLTDIEDKLAGEYPALGDMLRVFGSRQIRNRATMGGNLVTASPIGDSAPFLLALDASVVLAAETGERVLPLSDFFVSYRRTALSAGEVLKTILVPRGGPAAGLTRHAAWYKVSKRREMDISTVAASFVVEVDAQNLVRHVRLAYGGVAAMPVRARKTEAVLTGRPWTEATMQGALPVLAGEFTPISDVRGHAEYRQGLITSLLEKFFWTLGNVGGEENPAAAPGNPVSPPCAAQPHESAHKHVTGEALYTDDETAGKNWLEVWPVCSPYAHAKILNRDATAARLLPGIKAVLLAEDIPGLNDVGLKQDEPLLATNEVRYHGQLVGLIVGESQAACRAALAKVVVEYEPLTPLLTLAQALAAESFHNEPNYIRRGDCADAFLGAPGKLEGEFELGGQEHFYLETQAAWAEGGEDGSMLVVSSTQHPSEVQSVVAHVLHRKANQVVVKSPRMGGGFGGKETQAATPAALAALAAQHTGRPVRVRFNRDQDMALTGHRHPFLARFKVGYDLSGRLRAAQVHLWSNGGWAQDLSQAVTDRALFHLDNCYYIPAVEFRGQVAKTHLSSNTAFRGFGGPQGMLVMEEILDRVARRLGLAPEMVRERNLYHGRGETNTTPYGQEIEDNRIQTIWHELKRTSDLAQRRADLAAWNARNPHRKRGLAMTPVKFGISFTLTHLNQAGAFVVIYHDGTVQLNHGGTEMGQGLHTNMLAIAARELGAPPEHIRVMSTSTDKVPNTSPTAASAGTDLNGAAVQNACEILRARLLPVAQTLFQEQLDKAPALASIRFADGCATCSAPEAKPIAFAKVVKHAYLQRVSLSATGYYATPGIHWNRAAGRGRPFHYFANGAAVAEVEVDGLTGMHRVLRADILQDVGDSLNEGVNRGQVEGGFVQGMGWLTTEELLWDAGGQLLTHSPDTYKIPSVGDTPRIFNVALLKNATQKNVVHGTKAVGEPPLMLAISVREALRDAVAAFGAGQGEVALASPATCEAIWRAIQKQKSLPANA